VKAGRTPAGSQRYRCGACGRRHTPKPQARGYPPETRVQAIRQYVDGGNLRRIARQLGVVHQTVANWVATYADTLPDQAPQPHNRVATAELDELHTFVGDKKTRATW